MRLIIGAATAFVAILLSAEEVPLVYVADIAVTNAVRDREPDTRYEPPIGCQAVRPAVVNQIPSNTNAVYVWMKVRSQIDTDFRHVYYLYTQNGEQLQDVQETEYSLTDRVLRKIGPVTLELEADATLARMATFGGRIKKNMLDGWRTQSSKQIDRNVHQGVWKVEVHKTASTETPNPLCVVYFEI